MREHPRRRLMGRRPPVVRHSPPAESVNVAADLDDVPAVPGVCSCHGVALCPGPAPAPAVDVSRETSVAVGPMAPYVAGGQVPALSRERITRLEALTAQWARDVRVGGPGPDDTMLAPPALSRPPVPPARRPAPVEDGVNGWTTPEPVHVYGAALSVRPLGDGLAHETAEILTEGRADQLRAEFAGAKRVNAWASRHDPRSLEFAVRDRLAHPVPLQNVLLDRGPVLDQGTTPPLSAHDASACVGMAVVAAANVLDASSHPGYNQGRSDSTFLDVTDARAVYARAQHLDTVSGEAYAGTSVLAGMKAGQEAGYWDTYLWALGGTRDVAQALLQLRSAVVLGLPWSATLETPDAVGVIVPGGASAGGHALTAVGLALVHAGRPGPWFVLQQSRGPAEGLGGLVYLHHTHLAALLAGVGEAGVPLSRWFDGGSR